MGRQSKFPILYDECKTVNVSKLVTWGYLTEGKQVSGTLSWSRFGEAESSIGISVYNAPNLRFAELSYQHNGSPKRYRVNLTSVPSNLGKGRIWYFVCPVTQKRCKRLYLCRGYFYHREAFSGCFYEKQTYSRNTRSLCKQYESCFGVEQAYEKIYRKHFKKHYKGKPTKQYIKLSDSIRRGEKGW